MRMLFAPWVLLMLLGCLVLCLFKKWYKASLIVCILGLFLNWYWNVFSFGCDLLKGHKGVEHCRVMSWNISCSKQTSDEKEVDNILEAILNQDADVVFLTEYHEKLYPEIDSVMSAHYEYKGDIANRRSFGDVYSHVPIDTCMRIGVSKDSFLFRYDVRCVKGSLPLYCVHMQSNNLVNGGSFYPDSIKGKSGIKRYLENYRIAAEIRKNQADLIVNDISDAPCIVMGDMNDVSGSPALKTLERAGLKNAWWKGGFGYGATLHKPLPYRIDHIYYSDGLKLQRIRRVKSHGLSDHDALVADFVLE